MSTVLGTVPGTEEALSKCFSRLLLLFYYHCCCHLLSPGKAQQASTGFCRKDAFICLNRERREVQGSAAIRPGHRGGCAAKVGTGPRAPPSCTPISRHPPTPAPICRHLLRLGAGSSPSSRLWAKEAGAGAHSGLHVGCTREKPHVSVSPRPPALGRVGQAAAGLWRAASGALPGRPPLLRGCQRWGSTGAANASQPAGERSFSLPPTVTFQNRDSPAHSLPRKTRVTAAITLDVHLSFGHPPPTLPATPVGSL